MIPTSLAETLVEICGRDGVVLERDRLLVYESDGLTAYRHRPGAVVLPRTTDQVSRSVRAIAKHGLPIVPRGAGTGLSGGAAALNGAVVVGTARMNRILEIDPENRRAVLQPGVINAELSVAAAPYGLCYAPDPSSQTACTIGGNVAENSGGPHCLKWGTTSRWVTGLTVVLPDGSTARFGGLAGEGEAAGYDLTGLFVGSEGCFGIAVEIETALLPLPEGVRTLLAIFDRIEDAGRAVSAVVGAGLLPAAMEIIDGPTIRAVEDSVFAAGYPTDAEAALVVEFDGVEAGLDADAAQAAALCEGAGAREVRQARSEAERTALWKGRKKAFGAMGRIAPDLLVQDATVPRTRLPEVLKGIGETARRFDLVVANVFHAGDGNLHPNILFDRRDADQLERVEAASKEIMRLCIDAGGTITGEHGVGLDKKHHMSLVCGPDELAAMWGARRAFDPNGAMNPGKVLPDESEPGPDAVEYSAGERSAAGSPRVHGGGEPSASGGPARLADLLRPYPADRVLEGEAAREWARGFPAEAVVFPETVEEVQDTVRAAGRSGVQVVPAGRGSWLRAGGWTREAPLVVSTARLNSVCDYEPADLTLTAGAGIGWEELTAMLASNGQWLPLDPPGVGSGTLGGVVACGVSGPLQARYGTVRDNVLGVEVVTGDGRRLKLCGRVVKNVAGYDLVRLTTGSRGSLGIVTQLSMRLFPRPATAATLLFQGDLPGALDTARAVCTSTLPPCAVELLVGAGPGLGGGRAHGGDGGAHGGDAEATVAVRLGGGPAEVDALCAQVEELAGRPPSQQLRDADSRAFHGDRTRWEDGAQIVVRLAALPSHLDRTVEWAGQLAADLDGGQVCADVVAGVARVKGSCGAPLAGARSDAPAEAALFAERAARIRGQVEALGGTLTFSQAPEPLAFRAGWAVAPEQTAAPASASPTPPPNRGQHVARRIKAHFDPISTLAARCP